MSDLIERQAAYDTLTGYYHHTTEIQHKALREALERVPSAETPKKRTETHACDCISRQAAIDALKEHRNLFCDNTPDTFSVLPYGDKCRVDELDMAIATLINLPSAQPEIIACGSGELNAEPGIVRCKDCKHHDGIRCFRWNSTIITKFDDFCSNAERRTDE